MFFGSTEKCSFSPDVSSCIFGHTLCFIDKLIYSSVYRICALDLSILIIKLRTIWKNINSDFVSDWKLLHNHIDKKEKLMIRRLISSCIIFFNKIRREQKTNFRAKIFVVLIQTPYLVFCIIEFIFSFSRYRWQFARSCTNWRRDQRNRRKFTKNRLPFFQIRTRS